MAIVIEEEKNSSGSIMSVIGWLVFIAVGVGAVYYLFFAAPESVIVAPSANFASTTSLAGITIHASAVTQNPLFQSLKQYVPSSTVPSSTGRSNPFIPPQ